MADVKAIRDRVRDRLRTVTGINVLEFMVVNPVLPAVLVAPPPGQFRRDVTVDGCEDIELVATVLVSKTVEENAQNKLDEYASEGASDLAAAVESGSTADWDWAVVNELRNYGAFVFGAGDQAETYLGFEMPIQIGVS